MRWVVGVLLGLCHHAALAACGADPVPAPAQARGFTNEVFCDDFTSLSTLDLANTQAPGFKWYMLNFQGKAADPADFSIVGGGLQIKPTTNVFEDATNLQSCAFTDPAHEGYVGNAFRGGMYVNIRISSIPAGIPGNMWWPAAWMIGTSAHANGPPSPGWPTFPEIDFIEHNGGGRNLHTWAYGAGDVYMQYASTPSFTVPASYGVLVLTPAQNGGTGTLIGYKDDVLDGSQNPGTWGTSGLYSETSVAPMCILFTSGMNEPFVIRSVQVWQAGPSGATGRSWGRRR
jgi:hypothetical protein